MEQTKQEGKNYMRITEINIDNELGSKVGLPNNTMKRLGSLVALIGKNGSGKTRVLNLLEQILFKMTRDDIKHGHLQLLPKKAYEVIGFTKDEIAKFNTLNKKIKDFKSIGISDFDFQTFVQEILKDKVVRIDPDGLMNLQSSNSEGVMKFELAIDSNENRIDVFDSAALAKSGIVFINSLSSRLIIDEFHAKRRNKKIEEIPNYKIFNRFKDIVNKMLGINLSVEDITKEDSNTIEGIIHFNDQPFDYSILSPGQKVLFSYCIYFFIIDLNPSFNLKDSVIIIDEPERHLHPEAQIQLIEGVHNIIEDEGQLWIATHSVHILSHLKPDQIFYLDNGQIKSPSSMTPSKALDALLGYTYDKDELADLLLSTSQWAFSKFIGDCLINPEVIKNASKDDPQFLQLYEFLNRNKIETVLDYGAGHGRLEKILDEANMTLSFALDALEINSSFHEELASIKSIRNLYSDSHKLPQNHYDLVILSNVLHEIHLSKWKEVFKAIKESLKSGGNLMILEDLILPKGEAPNDIGYLVFGKEELKTLFGIRDGMVAVETKDESYKDRLMCAIIPKDYLYDVLGFTTKTAIRQLQQRSLHEIKKIRKSNDHRSGRKLGFYNQQYINCELALEFLDTLPRFG